MIPEFKGKYRFLSNFYEVPIILDNEVYRSVEYAYQAAKTFSYGSRKLIQKCPNPGRAKRVGKTVELRPDWEEKKLEIMLGFLRQKFQFPDLRKMLLDTGEEELQEGNYWHDTYWGVCYGQCHNQPGHSPIGDNNLGKLLMQVRYELQDHCCQGLGRHDITCGKYGTMK